MLVTGIPATNRFLGLLNNAGHAPIFAALAWILLQLIRSRWPEGRAFPAAYLAAFAAAVALGLAVEILQSFIGRDASWIDLAMDACGAGAVLGVSAAMAAGRRRPGVTAACLALAAACVALVVAPLLEASRAYARRAEVFPTIAAFEQPLDLYFLGAADSTLELIELPEPWAQGRKVPALAVRLDGPGNPGLRHNEPVPDWSGYTTLKVDLINPGNARLRLMLRVHDATHDQRHADRFNMSFTLDAGSRRVVAVPLEVIARSPSSRRMDMRRIAGIVLFERSRPAPVGAAFYVTRIWLE